MGMVFPHSAKSQNKEIPLKYSQIIYRVFSQLAKFFWERKLILLVSSVIWIVN